MHFLLNLCIFASFIIASFKLLKRYKKQLILKFLLVIPFCKEGLSPDQVISDIITILGLVLLMCQSYFSGKYFNPTSSKLVIVQLSEYSSIDYFGHHQMKNLPNSTLADPVSVVKYSNRS